MSATANIRAGRAYVEVTAETSKLKKSLDAAQSRLKDFGRACQGLGRDMMALGGALSLPFALAEKSFAGFDDRMRLVQAVTSSTGEEFDALVKTAQRLGRETSFTAQEVADAMTGLGRMGFDPSEITAAIEHVLNLSRATGTDLSESADIAANSLRIFGMEAGKMSHVADILTATANGSAQTLTDLFEGLKMAGPQAAAAGENISELCASLGIMANMGIKGSLAGTALRKAYVQFADVKVQNVLRDVGVEAVDANGNLKKMAVIMRDVAEATALAGNIEELDKFLARLRDVSGQADETARAMDRGIGGSFRLFRSAVEGTMNAVGEALSSTLQPMVARITAAINTFTKWVEANRGLVTSIAATVASIGAFGAAMFVVGTASRVLSAGVGVVSTAISGISGAFAALCSKGILVSNSFSLIAQAFSNYRNAAIPAMVGTSKLLAALNLPIDSRAKQIAAGLVPQGAEHGHYRRHGERKGPRGGRNPRRNRHKGRHGGPHGVRCGQRGAYRIPREGRPDGGRGGNCEPRPRRDHKGRGGGLPHGLCSRHGFLRDPHNVDTDRHCGCARRPVRVHGVRHEAHGAALRRDD